MDFVRKINDLLAAPFPWFGGKRRVARHVWQAFGEGFAVTCGATSTAHETATKARRSASACTTARAVTRPSGPADVRVRELV